MTVTFDLPRAGPDGKPRERKLRKVPAPAAAADCDDRPILRRHPGGLIVERDEAEKALARPPAKFYLIGERIVAPAVISIKGHGRDYPTPGVLQASQDAILAGLAERTRWRAFDKRAGDFVEKNPPAEIARLILAHAHASGFPPIAGVIGTPVPRPDGSIVTDLGYDVETCLYYLSDCPLPVGSIPRTPTAAEARDAAADLLHLLSGFRFVDGPSTAVGLSLLVTGVLRVAMDVSPMHAISAPMAGSGKSYLVDLAAMISIGMRAPMIGACNDGDEFEKRLVGALLDGMPILPLDNISMTLSSPLLSQAIERPIVRVRPLGSSAQITIPNRSLIVATGNALTVGGDNERRTLLCRLDPDTERPEYRSFDFDPIETVANDRARYVRACLILGNYGKFASQHRYPQLASFRMWDRSVRNALINLGIDDPALTIETVRAEAPARREATAVIELLRDIFKSESFVVKECVDEASGNSNLREALLAVAERGGVISCKRLGRWFRQHIGQFFGELKLCEEGWDSHAKVFRYKVKLMSVRGSRV